MYALALEGAALHFGNRIAHLLQGQAPAGPAASGTWALSRKFDARSGVRWHPCYHEGQFFISRKLFSSSCALEKCGPKGGPARILKSASGERLLCFFTQKGETGTKVLVAQKTPGGA